MFHPVCIALLSTVSYFSQSHHFLFISGILGYNLFLNKDGDVEYNLTLLDFRNEGEWRN